MYVTIVSGQLEAEFTITATVKGVSCCLKLTLIGGEVSGWVKL